MDQHLNPIQVLCDMEDIMVDDSISVADGGDCSKHPQVTTVLSLSRVPCTAGFNPWHANYDCWKADNIWRCRLLLIIIQWNLEELYQIFKEMCYTGHETPLGPLMARCQSGTGASVAIMMFLTSCNSALNRKSEPVHSQNELPYHFYMNFSHSQAIPTRPTKIQFVVNEWTTAYLIHCHKYRKCMTKVKMI